MGDNPSLGQRASIGPPPFFPIASDEAGVGAGPCSRVGPLERLRRRTRPIEHDRAKLLQSPAVAKIEESIRVGHLPCRIFLHYGNLKTLSTRSNSTPNTSLASLASVGASAWT